MTESQNVLNLAVLTGELLLKGGAEIFRVQETIIRILQTFDVEDYNVYVISNGIFVTINENNEEFLSAIRHVPLSGVHLGRIIEANQISREICDKSCSMEEAFKRLNNMKEPKKVKWEPLILACGLGSGCFCYLFGGNVFDSLLAFLLGIFLEIFLLLAAWKNMSKFISSIIGSVLVTLGSAWAVYTGIGVTFDKVVIGSIIPLVPGVVFTTSIRDFFNGDYLSGSIHLIDALLNAVCIAVGVGAAIRLFQVFVEGGLL